MMQLFKSLGQQRALLKQMQQANQYSLDGNPKKALDILEHLLKEHPTNVYIRHETVILQQKLNMNINLPNIESSFKNSL